MEVITVIKKKESGELITHVFETIENATESFPIINTYPEEQFNIDLPWGMNIHNYDTNINVKRCFVY